MISLIVLLLYCLVQPFIPLISLGILEESSFEPAEAVVPTVAFYLTSGWYGKSAVIFSYVYVAKLVVSWFLIVWLRLNLMRYRFDQVASYTWHELVVYSIAILLEIVVAYYVL